MDNNKVSLIDSTIDKLKMCGKQVTKLNDFACCYKDEDENITVYKVTYSKSGKAGVDNIGKFLHVMASPYFISVIRDRQEQYLGNPLTPNVRRDRIKYAGRSHGIYTVYNRGNILARYKILKVFGSLGNIYGIGARRSTTMGNVLIVETSNKIYAVNYKGYKRELDGLDKNCNYIVSTGDNGTVLIEVHGTVQKIAQIVTDIELKNICSFPKGTNVRWKE